MPTLPSFSSSLFSFLFPLSSHYHNHNHHHNGSFRPLFISLGVGYIPCSPYNYSTSNFVGIFCLSGGTTGAYLFATTFDCWY